MTGVRRVLAMIASGEVRASMAMVAGLEAALDLVLAAYAETERNGGVRK